MVGISARRSEDSSPATKKLSRHLLHLVSRAQMSPRVGTRASRSLWRQALLWPSSPAMLKKNARVAALEKSQGQQSK
ncbi:phosphatidylinositol 3 and 4-kinase-like protein [Phytophthora cinnamomi]|uniref:phosphatidylinositol 3 and 4-kinase-like protein n=1 Tax=Phytophthora cinnamomi TaxID=4785 RepID=UPI003559A46B|nr:phosphatidylinositol 3 and 4-kinase-like protein [Phytophthora cinnamomi]